MRYLWILAIVLSGCTTMPGKISFERNEKASVIRQFETFVSVPLEMDKRGDTLYVTDFKSDSLMWCYDLKRQKQFKQLLPRGVGPNEFLSPVQFVFLDSIILIHNRWHYSSRYYKLEGNMVTLKGVGERIHIPTDVDMIYPISSSRYVASGRFTDGRFAILDEKGEAVSYCGDYPDYDEGEKNIPNFPKFMFHQSMFGYHAESGTLAAVTSHVFELWNYLNDSLSLRKRILLSPYSYRYSMGDMWASAEGNGNVELGVKRIYTTEENIYMLYDPNTEEMCRARENDLNSEIWVFDWSGEQVRRIQLDSKIKCFCVDEQEKTIYCIMDDAELSVGKCLI